MHAQELLDFKHFTKVTMYLHQAPLTIAKQEKLIIELKSVVKERDTDLASLKDQLIKITTDKHRVDLLVTGLQDKLYICQDAESRLLQAREDLKVMHSRCLRDRD
jgi:uncharacterized coiled-coil protein SlyX